VHGTRQVCHHQDQGYGSSLLHLRDPYWYCLRIGAALDNSLRKKKSKLFFSKCYVVDMVCLMNTHQEIKKTFCQDQNVFFRVVVFLLAKMGFWLVFLLVYLSVCLLLSF
jgi:hypothetical protein